MPGINVSSLNGGDLRRLLKIAHARQDGLLADRLEWEIASRATRVVRPAAAFATLPGEDYEEWADGATASEAAPFAPGYSTRARASGRRRVMLVTLGAVTGSLLSVTVFWGLARMDGVAALVRDEPHPTRAMTVRAAPPATEQVAAAPAPEPLPPPEPIMPQARAVAPEPTPVAPAPAPTPPVEVAKAAPAKPVIAKKAPKASKPTAAKTQVAAKKPAAGKHAPPKKARALKKAPAAKTHVAARDVEKPAVTQPPARAQRKPRPPTLDEWLAGSRPAAR